VVTFGQIPPIVASKIEGEIHWMSTNVIGLFAHEKLLCSLGILKCSEGPIERPDILTAYVRLSSLALFERLAKKIKE
jgi:hypothetical protein